MHALTKYHDYASVLVRAALAAVLVYFGQDAVRNSELHMNIWLAEWTLSLPLIGTPQFIFVLGIMQLLLALMLVLGVYLRYASLAVAALLVGIVVNLILLYDHAAVFRNLVLIAASLMLATQQSYRFALKN